MLNQILHEIESAQGPQTINELSRKLGMEPDTLEGMLQFWVRKGRIQMDEGNSSGDEVNGGCTKSCSGTAECVYIAKMPKTFSLPK